MLGCIGIGNMGSAIINGALKQGYLKADEVYIYDIDGYKAHDFALKSGVKQASSVEQLIEECSLIMIAIKPYFIEELINVQRNHLKNKALLSIALGYDFKRYQELLDDSTRHLFVMPNTPCLVGAGMALFEETHSFNQEEYGFVKGMFESIGEVVSLPSRLMGVGGAMSGSSPAYVYMFIEALADAGVKHGMPRDLAYTLASQTVLGAGKMQLDTKTHPGILKDQVCSPGGTTIQGVEALEKGQFRATVMDAIDKAIKK